VLITILHTLSKSPSDTFFSLIFFPNQKKKHKKPISYNSIHSRSTFYGVFGVIQMCLYGVEKNAVKSYDQRKLISGNFTTLPAYFVTIKRFKKRKKETKECKQHESIE